MRELKGGWTDLFNGFMLALDLRKMFLGFCGIIFSMGPLAVTAWVGNEIDPDAVKRPDSLALDEVWGTICQALGVIYRGTPGHPADWKLWLPHLAGMIVALTAIWAYFGGAIARIAAYEIAKDGERIETARALEFSRKKFWSFFMAPFICLLGLGFFFFCNFAGGVVGRVLDFIVVGGPLVALLLPLALLSGFIMTLIGLGTLGGAPLFAPAVAAEGTDAFDAVSRGFSYVYSRPWHFLWYQVVAKMYGAICISFVILFAVTLCHLGLKAGATGFDLFGVRTAPEAPAPPPLGASAQDREAYGKKLQDYNADRLANPDKYLPRHDRFQHIVDVAWSEILSERYDDRHSKLQRPSWKKCPEYLYVQLSRTANRITKPDRTVRRADLDGGHRVALWIVLVWLIGALGIALGYIPSYAISQQTLIYFLLRKKVDGIEMNEVFEEIEEEPAPAAPAGEAAKAEPPKPEEKPPGEEKKP